MNSIGQTVFELESGNENVDGQTDGQTNGQMNGQNYTNFERNLAMMVIYVPVKFDSIGQTVFELESGNEKWMDRRMDRQTNEWNFTNFERNLAMMVIYLPLKFEFDWTNRFRVRVRKQKMWMDRRTSDTSI